MGSDINDHLDFAIKAINKYYQIHLLMSEATTENGFSFYKLALNENSYHAGAFKRSLNKSLLKQIN